MVENCDTCACFPVCDRKFNMFGVFMGWADCNNWIPEVKRGKWGEAYYHYGECDFVCDCSECGEPYSPPTRYCPNCGARMCKE